MPESSNRPLCLATLPEDVLLIILSFCDVEDIVSLSKVSVIRLSMNV